MTVPMNTAVRDKWIAALTSGKYEQGREQLARKGRYCCLGVLCEVAIDEGVIDRYSPGNPFPPTEVMEWAGLRLSGGFPVTAQECVTWNDDEELTFAEIAARLA